MSGITSWLQPKASREWYLSTWMVMGLVVLAALLAFEVFNYDTSRFGLETFLGGAQFMGVSWADLLAIAACLIDIAGLARLFTETTDIRDEPPVIILLGIGWIFASAINALLTWWSVRVLVISNAHLSDIYFPRELLIEYVPAILAGFIWLTRLSIIGTIAVAGDKFFHPDHLKKGGRAPKVTTAAPSRPATPQTVRQPVPARPQMQNKPAPRSPSPDRHASIPIGPNGAGPGSPEIKFFDD